MSLFKKLPKNQKVIENHEKIENIANTLVRSFDSIMGTIGLGGRKGNYDDYNYQFFGGEKDGLRKKHYDKSLKLLWKAQEHAPWSSFDDCTNGEVELIQLAKSSFNEEEKKEYQRISNSDYKDFLKKTYSLDERKAIANILALIGHGEAYAWMVSTEILNEVKSTGGRAALTAQVLEEAKHFVVLREIVRAFDVEIPRLSAWEYVLLERGFKSKGLEKFFAMNVVVEGFALNLFGMLSHLPGLEILRLFHLDESRHTALPTNYFKEFPMSFWEKHSPIRRIRRFSLILPALPVFVQIESDLAEIGVDGMEFGGSMARKVANLADKVGFHFPMSKDQFASLINLIFNAYCKTTREGHEHRDFMKSETTKGKKELAVEKEVFRFKTA
ncbi:MAG: ferritin-like domain-containing protein [Bacteriovoracaceae bacterium]|nr:ferritin-like domain-containing protein [Bacteriovoracaceae bacterium]